MVGRCERAVRPARHEIADIDDVRARDRRRIDPHPAAIANLQRLNVVILAQDGEAFVVRVSAIAHAGLIEGAGLAWVVQDAHQRHRRIGNSVEVVLGQLQCQSERVKQQPRQALHAERVFAERVAEAGQVIGPKVADAAEIARPELRTHLHVFDGKVECLVQVGLADLRVGILIAVGDVAELMGRLLDVDLHLLAERAVEQPATLREDLRDEILRHAMVDDVEEAHLGAGPAQGDRNARLGRGVITVHSGEVDLRDVIEVGERCRVGVLRSSSGVGGHGRFLDTSMFDSGAGRGKLPNRCLRPATISASRVAT